MSMVPDFKAAIALSRSANERITKSIFNNFERAPDISAVTPSYFESLMVISNGL
ncbi:hypothetical protein D3C80_1228280 [compost metagenome]